MKAMYRYVIGSGNSTITDQRPGQHEQVKKHAERFMTEIKGRGAMGAQLFLDIAALGACIAVQGWRR